MYIRRMARSYAIAEARANLPTLIDEVEAGTAVELTRRGRVVAVMISIAEYQRLRHERVSFQDAYQQFRRKHDVAQAGLEPGFTSKLRDRTPGRKVTL